MLEEITCFKKQVSIPGINFYIHGNNTFLIASDNPLKVLSSAVLGADLHQARYIINHTVDKDYNGSNPERDLSKVAAGLGLGKEVLGMMTAVSITHTFLSHVNHRGLSVATFCTAGIGNPGVAGLPIGKVTNRQKYGTINLILLIDGNLTASAMVNAVITATEAKTRALFKANVCLPDGELVTGTTTDALVIACTGKGQALSYAGTATDLGYYIGRTTSEAIFQGVANYISLSGAGEYIIKNKGHLVN
ncbi:adenosylcobinamide amidohydrolase [Desulfoscipio sp. XC116]|uniref:adenosylcobinamide amidohydrolase n=1 Tax=Desulfoscipio sp. XC116 TaxID=3144975 RepID=UPI00325B695F